MQNEPSPTTNDARMPDAPPPKGTCCSKLAAVLDTKPRMVLEFSLFGIPLRTGHAVEHDFYAKSMYSSDFDNLGPIGCADVIQAEEARKAQEWAGDA